MGTNRTQRGSIAEDEFFLIDEDGSYIQDEDSYGIIIDEASAVNTDRRKREPI